MTTLQVYFKESHRQNKARPFELITTSFDDLSEAMDAIGCDELIRGEVLITRRTDNPREAMIINRFPIGFRGAAVDRVQPLGWKLIDRQAAS